MLGLRPLALAVAVLGLAPGVAPGQAPGGARPPGVPGGSGETRLRAETQEVVEKGHYRARGFVDLETGGTRIQCDQLDLYETERPDGTRGRRIVAVGNVVFLRDEERIAGERLEMDLDTGKGTFEKALGYLQPGVFVEAQTIERLDATTYRVAGASFTSCSQPNPRWGFTASSASIHVDDKIVGHNVLFKVKSVPALFVPLFVYPIREDQRSSGLLFPHFGYSSLRGFDLGEGFFWAIGRSFDQTFYVDRYSRFGYGYGHELRYALDAPSRATFRTYVFKPQGGGDLDYDLDWSALQMLPGRVKGSLQVRQYSNLLFQQTFQDNLNQASVRTRGSAVGLQRNMRAVTVRLFADSMDTFFGEGLNRRVNRHLPTLALSRSPQRVGRSGLVFGFEARAESLEVGDEERADRYSRLDLAPDLSLPFGSTFLQVTPRVALRYTRYGKTATDEGIDGPGVDRSLFDGSVELRGPMFSRVYNNPGQWYTDKVKHVIGPEITFQYRTAVHDFDLIPKFDGNDQLLGTDQVQYGLVQRFLARRPAPGGKLVPYEFLSWRIGQTYYVQIADNQNEFDPNYSSSAFGPGGLPDHNSPLQSQLRFRPSRAFSTNFDVEYDVNFKQVRTLSLSGALDTRLLGLQGGWSRAIQLSSDPAQRVVNRDFLRSSGRLELVPDHLTLSGSADYDIILKNLLHSSAKLAYRVQCCGFTVELIRYQFNGRDERQFRFSLELANIGSIGNFLGDQAGARSGAVGGFGGLQ